MPDDGEDHGEAAERAHFRDGAGASAEEADEENRDLALQTKEDGVGRLVFDEADHGAAIVVVFRRVEIDNGGDVAAGEPILEHEGGGADEDGEAGIQKNEGAADENDESRDRARDVDLLNARDVGAQAGDDGEDAEGHLHGEREEDERNERERVGKGGAVARQHEIKNGRDDEDGEAAQFPAQLLRGGDELSETMRIVPDATADGDEADADPDIGEDIDRALHRIRDREVGVFALIEVTDEENPAGETDALHQDLDGGEVPDDAGVLEGAAHHRHRVFVQQGRGSGAKEAHQ